METSVIIFFLTVVVGGIGMWLRKRYLKKIMEQGLGRKVEDREITDIGAWMDAIPDESDRRGHPPRPRT